MNKIWKLNKNSKLIFFRILIFFETEQNSKAEQNLKNKVV
jgi:hypothetical protein